MVWLYLMVKKTEDIFIRFDTMHERDTHTHTYTHTQTPHDGIGRAYAWHRAAKTYALDTLVLSEQECFQ